MKHGLLAFLNRSPKIIKAHSHSTSQTKANTHFRVCWLLLFAVLGASVPVFAQPTISSLSATSGIPGNSITITGTSFDATHTNNTVFIGGVKATTTAGNVTSITATIPNGATFGSVIVQTNNLSALSLESFLPTYSGVAQTITSSTLSGAIDFATGAGSDGVVTADFDGDGKLDVAVANSGANTISTFENQSASGNINAGSFATKVDLTTASTPRHMAVGDLDGDGLLDLVVANSGANSVSVFHNTSSGSVSFATKVDFTTDTSPFHVAIGDLDGDGKPELVVSSNAGSKVAPIVKTNLNRI